MIEEAGRAQQQQQQVTASTRLQPGQSMLTAWTQQGQWMQQTQTPQLVDSIMTAGRKMKVVRPLTRKMRVYKLDYAPEDEEPADAGVTIFRRGKRLDARIAGLRSNQHTGRVS